jgi:hypothetical protein
MDMGRKKRSWWQASLYLIRWFDQPHNKTIAGLSSNISGIV